MFRQGKPRTLKHNLRLASMLSFVAGIVNICGLLSVRTLTTNVTGHFAYFVEELMNGEFLVALVFISYIFFFLFGAFMCGLLINLSFQKNPDKSHTLPIVLEIIMLISAAILPTKFATPKHWVAIMLLFAMGLQNALVTQVSKATVRTTHLTGLFTDLGIELSQLIFHRRKEEQQRLSRSIFLRITIIIFFLLGGVLGGFSFGVIKLDTLLIAGLVLLAALVYHIIPDDFVRTSRHLKNR
jgi:uncharacterized membrane protein YoaK (UPF0700 family)